MASALAALLTAMALSQDSSRAVVAPSPIPAAALIEGEARGGCPHARRGLIFYRSRLGHHLFRLGARPEGVPLHVDGRPSALRCERVRLLARRTRARSWRARQAFEEWFERTYAKYRCVHREEGAWDDSGWPYWGGLQMDLAFQRAYGREYLRRWGTADRWPVWAQLRAAERAHRVRGWHPWPNTARECGLL